MTPSILTAYTNGANADSVILGRVAMFSVFETVIRHDVLESLMTQAGLDIRFLPAPPADVDVFRRVTTAAQSKRNENPDGTYSNVLVRDVSNDEFKVLRRLVVETVDAKGDQLSYLEAFDLTYDKGNGRFVADKRGRDFTIADSIVGEITADYNARRGTVNAEALRTLIGRVFNACHSTSLRPTGGVYFTLLPHFDQVEALERLADFIPTMTIWSFNLREEGGKETEMVGAAVVDETERDIDAMLAEAKAILKAGNISPRRVATVMAAGRQTRDKVVAHQELLGDKMSGLDARLQLLDLQMVALMDKATA